MINRLALSYVWHDEQCFQVSTINRPSSAVLAYGDEYAETMVWKYDLKNGCRGECIYQGEAAKDSLRTHDNVSELLIKTGLPELVEQDENQPANQP